MPKFSYPTWLFYDCDFCCCCYLGVVQVFLGLATGESRRAAHVRNNVVPLWLLNWRVAGLDGPRFHVTFLEELAGPFDNGRHIGTDDADDDDDDDDDGDDDDDEDDDDDDDDADADADVDVDGVCLRLASTVFSRAPSRAQPFLMC